jgi:thiamine-phosphate pyrophosphorylase
MSDSLQRPRLARAAARLAAQSRCAVPPLVLMTDDDRLPDPLAAARALPRGSMIVVRSRDPAKRKRLAKALTPVARRRGLVVVVAGDAALAVDGLHLSEARLGEAAHWRARRGFVITASIHSLAGLRKAGHLDAVFLSPVFATRSHPERVALTAARANLMARQACVPVYALGGVDARNAALLSGFSGIAAIGALG